ncbi:MAG TPA: SMC-Scp complex subunit ScpB [Polyangiaceae bacterium]|nr:SMC-Scp complex subunit ScpB [Polyangiaceae bacterium]
MSKRKGRRQSQTSEIKSVMRAPLGAADEPASGSLAVGDAAASDEPEPGDGAAAHDAAAPDAPESSGEADHGVGAAEAEPASESLPLGAAAALDAHETASDEVAESTDGGVPAAPDLDGAEDAEGSDPVEDADDEQGARFAEPISFDDAGDDTEGFLRGLVEALLFTSQKPIDVKDLARSAGIDKPRARELIEQLRASYEGRGLCIEEVAGGFVMRSSPRYAPYIHRILALKPVRLSRAQLETLAIVAYRQPVTKPEVDDIRGVDSGQVIKGLLERALLKMLGKKDEPGHPTLYGTTNEFLELLNLQSLKDLPTLREYTELSEESQRKFQEATGEAAPSETLTFERPAAAATPFEAGEEAGEGEAPAGELQPDESAGAEPAGGGDLLFGDAALTDDEAARDAYAGARAHSDVVAVDAAELGEPEGVGGEADERVEGIASDLEPAPGSGSDADPFGAAADDELPPESEPGR